MFISKERKKQLCTFKKKYGIKFKHLEFLNQAFVHTSYTNENNLSADESYEKLEFYGDAVLKLIISDFLYNHFSNYNEGELTKLRAEIVSDKNIFKYAKKLGFEDLIVLGKNEKKQGGAKKESILACAFEALLGAIFIENKQRGYKKTYEFLKENFYEDILEVEKNICFLNPKAILQEYTQGINHQLPEYILVGESGKAHKKEFSVEVKFQDEILGRGTANSIKKAQVEAAFEAIKKLNLIKE